MKKRVLICEPSAVIFEGLAKILREGAGLEVFSQEKKIENLQARISELRPDFLILNPTLFLEKKRLQSLISSNEKTAFVALVYQYVDRNLRGLFSQKIEVCDDVATILEIFNSSAETSAARAADDYELTDREREILVLVAKGFMSKEIADKLNISIHTVVSHRKNLTRKTGIKSVAGLAVYAMLNNLME